VLHSIKLIFCDLGETQQQYFSVQDIHTHS